MDLWAGLILAKSAMQTTTVTIASVIYCILANDEWV